MVVIDGMENEDYKYCHSLNNMSIAGSRNNTPTGMETDSLNCIMNILGVEKEKIPKGRAYLEALALGMDISDNDLVFRCNLVNVDEHNILTSSCGDEKVHNIANDNFYIKHIEKHKNLLVVKNSSKYFDGIKTYPPHQNIGKPMKSIEPVVNDELKDILANLLNEYSLFAWGQAVKETTPSFYELHNKTGAIIAKTEVILGIAKAMQMYCPILKNATADIDTDLSEKTKLSLELTQKYDFVMLHINGVDECGHRKSKTEKINFIREIDKQVLRYIIKNAPKELSVIITADHETSSQTGKHINSDVCYYIINENEECLSWLKR